MDVDHKNFIEENLSFNMLVYAVDENGICHISENKNEISESILILSNQIDNSLQLTNENLFVENFSTQPFSMIDLNETNFTTLHLFDNEISTAIYELPLHIAEDTVTQYENNPKIVNQSGISKRKKIKYKFLKYTHRQQSIKRQIWSYLRKRKRKNSKNHNNSNNIVRQQSQEHQSNSTEEVAMIDFHLLPDLSKRKYIYKDVTLTENNSNQINLRIFQCTQQPSTGSCPDQMFTNDRTVQPLYFIKNMVSIPDIRIGLSRRHSIKKLHKIIVN